MLEWILARLRTYWHVWWEYGITPWSYELNPFSSKRALHQEANDDSD